ncbi:MAG: insulinase family protein [Clostridia bacterium]|nr:insulinase family protein [Clostridia bacterium]
MTNHIEELYSSRIGERYFRIRHRSGMTICVMPKRSATTYAILGVNCGSIDNRVRFPDGSVTCFPDGTAHFLEHKLFAARDGEDAIARFARYGATADAFTTPDITAYLFSCTENVTESLEVLLDFVLHPYFTEENVALERSIIEQEIRMYDDIPSQTAFYRLMESMYATHPIRINVGGTTASVASITPEVLYRFYRAFYHPSNMTLAIAGNITAAEVLDVCDRMLSFVAAAEPVERVFAKEQDAIVRARTECYAQLGTPLLYVGVKDTALFGDPLTRMKKSAAVGILNDILFCKSSRFFNDLYAKGLINAQFGAEYEHAETYSYALISAETKSVDDVCLELFEYLEKKRQSHDITAAEFERCHRVMYASAVTAFESAEDMASDCLDAVMGGGELFDSIEIMTSVTREDLFRELDALYRPEAFSVSIVYPQ